MSGLIFDPETSFEVFKDAQGRHRTASLFMEYENDSYPAFYTLKTVDTERNGKTYLSLYKLYMSISDPTEYRFAIGCFGSFKHWDLIQKASWLKPLVEEWRKELKVRMESERYQEMVILRDASEGATKLQATKWLADRYGEKPSPKRGRPSKQEKEHLLKQEREEQALLEEDAARIGLKIVK